MSSWLTYPSLLSAQLPKAVHRRPARLLGSSQAQGAVLNGLGLAYRSLDEHRQAIKCYEEAQAINREGSWLDHKAECDSLVNLGTTLQKQLEAAVKERAFLQQAAIDAYQAYLRSYAAHSKVVQRLVHVGQLHLGHVAKSFALKEVPSKLATHQQKRAAGARAPAIVRDRAERAFFPRRAARHVLAVDSYAHASSRNTHTRAHTRVSSTEGRTPHC